MNQDNVRLASLYMLIASFSFALMGAFVKLASENLGTGEIVFFRNLFGLFAIVATFKAIPLSQTGGKPWLLATRGLLGTLALFAVFYNMATIPLAKAVTFVQTSPIFTAFFAYLFLNEKLDSKGWAAIVLGFVGILFITRPEGLVFSKNDILGIFSGVFAALAYTSVRELNKYYDTRIIVLSFLVSGAVVPIFAMWLGSLFSFDASFDFLFAPFVLPKGIDWLWLLGVSVCALAGQLYITKAYGEAKAGIVSVVGYSNIAFSALLGYFFGDAALESHTLVGIAIIVICGVIVGREKKFSA